MKNKITKFFAIAAIAMFSTLCCSCSLSEYFMKGIMGNIPFVKNFIQKKYNTYTSITNIRAEMKLVTGKQQLDFINIMDGKDGRYLEISTYEVRAGIDFSKAQKERDSDGNEKILTEIEILSTNKIHTVVGRSEAEKNDADFYGQSIKPVNIAYEQKARDYAVELGLLENAKDGAERTIKKLMDIEPGISVGEYKNIIELPYLPLELQIHENYLKENKLINGKDIVINLLDQPKNQFNRDALILKHVLGDWSIRIGDSGQTFRGDFNDFYRNVFETNTNQSNDEKERVEIFRYFDPMYPRESEVLSYASDSYRTFFLLSGGRIYYIDAVYNDEQTLQSQIAPFMVYLASSIRTIWDRKIERADEYRKYVENYFAASLALRDNKDRNTIKVASDNLVKSNILRIENETATAETMPNYTQDEKYFLAVADVKNLGRKDADRTVTITGDGEFDETNNLISQLYFAENDAGNIFVSDEARENAITTASELDMRIQKSDNVNLGLQQYLIAYFLKNSAKFGLTSTKQNKYMDDMKNGNITIASPSLIAALSDTERNEYFYKMFCNRLSMSHFYKDTARKIDDQLKNSERSDGLMFAYFNIPEFKKMTDGDVLTQIKARNGDKEIRNAFVLVFTQTEFDFGLFQDEDIHAFVFDDSTLRFFPNIGSQNIIEKAGSGLADARDKIMESTVGKAALYVASPVLALLAFGSKAAENDNPRAKFYHYGDWKNLRITPENVSIAGHNFGTKKLTKKGKSEYRNTNDYAEKSVIATVIDDLQHAYSTDEKDYYYKKLYENLEYQTQHYVYGKMFRPSPRMILDMRKDEMQRYNM